MAYKRTCLQASLDINESAQSRITLLTDSQMRVLIGRRTWALEGWHLHPSRLPLFYHRNCTPREQKTTTYSKVTRISYAIALEVLGVFKCHSSIATLPVAGEKASNHIIDCQWLQLTTLSCRTQTCGIGMNVIRRERRHRIGRLITSQWRACALSCTSYDASVEIPRLA